MTVLIFSETWKYISIECVHKLGFWNILKYFIDSYGLTTEIHAGNGKEVWLENESIAQVVTSK